MFRFCLKSISTLLAALYVVWAVCVLVSAPSQLLSTAGLIEFSSTLLIGAGCVAFATVLFAVPVAAFCATWAVFMIGIVSLLERDPTLAPPPAVAYDTPPGAIEFLETRLDVHDATCLVCKTQLDHGTVTCISCDAPYHRDCWDYAQGCSRFACSESTSIPLIEVRE